MNRFNLDGHKLHYHLDRVTEWQHGDRSKVFPIYVEVSPVGHCNHRCSFCALDYIGYQNRALDTERFKLNIMDMAVHGVRSIMYAGEGEPLLHPDISEIVEYTDRNGIDVAITTNAVALTRRFCDQALHHCSWIKVSCNAGDKQTYAKIHGTEGRDYRKVWKNIQYAVNLRDTFVLNKTTIGVQCVLLPDNVQSLWDLAVRCKEVGVDYLVIKPYSHHLMSNTTHYSALKYTDNYEQYTEPLKDLVSSKFEIVVRKESMEEWDNEEREYDKCYSVPYFWAYIMATGEVYGCSAYLGDKRFAYGNVNSALFSDVWLGAGRKSAMGFVDNELDIKECRRNCRMHKCNQFLHGVQNAGEHKNFI